MNVLFNAIIPIFLIVLTGFLLAKTKLIKADIAGALMQYVFYGAAPGVVFYAVITNPISKLLYWKFWIAYPASLITMIALTFIIFKYLLRRSHFTSMVAGFLSATGNTVIIGYPILAGFIGHQAAIPMAITVLAFSAVFIPLFIFIYEMKLNVEQGKSVYFSTQLTGALFSTVKNPIVLAAIVALTIMVFHVPIPTVIHQFTFYMGRSIIPVALFAVGLDLSSFKIKGAMTDICLITVLNLVMAPIVAIIIAKVFHLSPSFAVALVIFSAVPTAKTLYMIAGKYQIYNKEVAAVISLTTVFALVTLPFYSYIAHKIWPTAFIK